MMRSIYEFINKILILQKIITVAVSIIKKGFD